MRHRPVGLRRKRGQFAAAHVAHFGNVGSTNRHDDRYPLAAVPRQRRSVDDIAHKRAARRRAHEHLDIDLLAVPGRRPRQLGPAVRPAVAVRNETVVGDLPVPLVKRCHCGLEARIGIRQLVEQAERGRHLEEQIVGHVPGDFRFKGERVAGILGQDAQAREAVCAHQRGVRGAGPRSRAGDREIRPVGRPLGITGDPGVKPVGRANAQRQRQRRDNAEVFLQLIDSHVKYSTSGLRNPSE